MVVPGLCPKAEMPRVPPSGLHPSLPPLYSHPGVCHGPFTRVPSPTLPAFTLAISPPFRELTAALFTNPLVLLTFPQVPRLPPPRLLRLHWVSRDAKFVALALCK